MNQNNTLSRRAFLLGAVAVVGATVLPTPAKAVGGASIASGVLASGMGTPMSPPSCDPLWRIRYTINEFGRKANAWLQDWVQNTVGKETYEIFKGWFGTWVAP